MTVEEYVLDGYIAFSLLNFAFKALFPIEE